MATAFTSLVCTTVCSLSLNFEVRVTVSPSRTTLLSGLPHSVTRVAASVSEPSSSSWAESSTMDLRKFVSCSPGCATSSEPEKGGTSSGLGMEKSEA